MQLRGCVRIRETLQQRPVAPAHDRYLGNRSLDPRRVGRRLAFESPRSERRRACRGARLLICSVGRCQALLMVRSCWRGRGVIPATSLWSGVSGGVVSPVWVGVALMCLVPDCGLGRTVSTAPAKPRGLCSAFEVRPLGRWGAMSAHEQVIGLAEAIEALRAALTEATDQGKGKAMQFRVEPIELALKTVVTKDASGKIGWGALGVGGSYESATTQVLTLRLQPIWRTADGSIVEDFTVADQASAPQRFGPRQPPGESDDQGGARGPETRPRGEAR